MSETMLWFILVAIVPLVPAAFCFWLLKGSTASAKGSLGGLPIQIGGPAAGYLIFFYLLRSFAPKPDETGATARAYTFEGYLALKDHPSIPAQVWGNRVSARLLPGTFNVNTNGRLQVKLLYDPALAAAEQPSLVIDGGSCGSATVDLKSEQPREGQPGRRIRIDNVARTIEVADTIYLSNWDPHPAQADSVFRICGKELS